MTGLTEEVPRVARIQIADVEQHEHVGAIEVAIPIRFAAGFRAKAEIGLQQRRQLRFFRDAAVRGWQRNERPHMLVGRCQMLAADLFRSEEHTSELQSIMRLSYAFFCL